MSISTILSVVSMKSPSTNLDENDSILASREFIHTQAAKVFTLVRVEPGGTNRRVAHAGGLEHGDEVFAGLHDGRVKVARSSVDRNVDELFQAVNTGLVEAENGIQ